MLRVKGERQIIVSWYFERFQFLGFFKNPIVSENSH